MAETVARERPGRESRSRRESQVAVVGEVERVYRDQGARIWRAMVVFSGDPEVASDAVAESFAQALRRGDEIRSVENWVWRTAYRVAAGLLHDRRLTNGGLSDRVANDPSTGAEMPSETLDLLDAIRALSPKQRGAIILYYYCDQPVREVASRLGSTPGAVAVHLHRARQRLRSLLEVTDV